MPHLDPPCRSRIGGRRSGDGFHQRGGESMGRIGNVASWVGSLLTVALIGACGGEKPAEQPPAAAETAPAAPPAPTGASAALADATGKPVGTATLSSDSAGAVVMEVD